MMGDEDDLDLRLETRLGDELRQQLDRQLGRAAPYFVHHCTVPNAGRESSGRRRRRRYLGFVAAAAACCAAVIAWNRFQPGEIPRTAVGAPSAVDADNVARIEKTAHAEHPPDRSPSSEEQSPTANAGSSESLILASALSARTVDDGVLLIGRTPMRKIRRQWLERVEWFDRLNGARVQRIVPHEEVSFVPLSIN